MVWRYYTGESAELSNISILKLLIICLALNRPEANDAYDQYWLTPEYNHGRYRVAQNNIYGSNYDEQDPYHIFFY